MRKLIGRKATSLAISALIIVVLAASAFADGLTKEQGDAILHELRQIRTLLERQQPPTAKQPSSVAKKVSIKLQNEYSIGSSDAPVTMLEYTDYQCPYCNRFHTGTYSEIKKNFIDTGKVRFIKRDLALPFHQNALKAAQAARCAGDQGKFWEMHDLLSANPKSLGLEFYTKYASNLGLDATSFKSCIESDKHLADIRESGQGAGAIGITGTPSFVIGTVKDDTLNGVKIVGARPYSVFEKAIKDILATQTGAKAAK
jgi:protein-disulfide isomerase